MNSTVKRATLPNRLPASYAARLRKLDISSYDVAAASWHWHTDRQGKQDGHEVSDTFIRWVLLARSPCPQWLREQLEAMLAAAEQGK